MVSQAPDLVLEMRRTADERARPGQAVGALVEDRLPDAGLLGEAAGTALRRQDWQAESDLSYACYGRSRYGSGRYRVVNG